MARRAGAAVVLLVLVASGALRRERGRRLGRAAGGRPRGPAGPGMPGGRRGRRALRGALLGPPGAAVAAWA
jgi:hypothetical protein